ncbi:MAG: N-acetylmuramidase family protein [Microscillaceae bacterium]|nr:N-acetylmuramidase family protein [Microscillaceae bacterium]MDW8461412.1 hypothetical protein [Cytophagales bacterium]
MKKIIGFLLTILILVGLYAIYQDFFVSVDQHLIEKTNKNYGAEIERICQKLKLPAAYFKALIVLECSGDKPAKSRYEKHVFYKLLAVKNGELKSYGKITQKHLRLLSDATIKKLATSWGPMQIMGYHCINMGYTIEDLSGEEALRYGILWCEYTYGEYLRNGDFKNAFHIHNTGKPFPKLSFSQTYNPEYVRKGLAYMQKFEQ